MVRPQATVEEVWNWLDEIPDPELPALSITDLGIVRDVEWSEDSSELIVKITPTYSGCPAMEAIASDIRSVLEKRGIGRLRLETKLSPAWTTDWLSDRANERLRLYGIAPPVRVESERVACPRCGSNDTEVVSRFGSTPCKALYRCRSCLEPFDAFKRH
jgi:ring-1,2-phenylacetyl-CoA epoxidase subunit PaaD